MLARLGRRLSFLRTAGAGVVTGAAAPPAPVRTLAVSVLMMDGQRHEMQQMVESMSVGDLSKAISNQFANGRVGELFCAGGEEPLQRHLQLAHYWRAHGSESPANASEDAGTNGEGAETTTQEGTGLDPGTPEQRALEVFFLPKAVSLNPDNRVVDYLKTLNWATGPDGEREEKAFELTFDTRPSLDAGVPSLSFRFHVVSCYDDSDDSGDDWREHHANPDPHRGELKFKYYVGAKRGYHRDIPEFLDWRTWYEFGEPGWWDHGEPGWWASDFVSCSLQELFE